MKDNVNILLAEDDEGHASLVKKNLKRAGINNTILHFNDGQAILDFLFEEGNGEHIKNGIPYLLLLDIRMPKVDGIQVLEKLKQSQRLSIIPVIMITTTDDPKEVDKCHRIGCSNYISKPIDYDKFVDAVKHLGLFLKVIEVPAINGLKTKSKPDR